MTSQQNSSNIRRSALQKRYDALHNNYEELLDHLHDLEKDQKLAHTELRYMNAFIKYKKLDDEFAFFREHAHEVHDEDQPFPTLTL